jgi:release factor glutamine methyltransferase
LQELVAVLSEADVENAEAEAFELMRCVLGLRRAEVGAAEVEGSQATRVTALATRRAAGVPLQYLTGVAGFRHIEIKVGPGVLVPRPETEIVTGRALTHLPEGGTCVDVGTGSGAIALSVAHERPDATVLATEAAPDALRWARLNRKELGLPVEIVAGDLFDGLPEDLRGRVDVIVSNPPYVGTGERALLPVEVVDHEPHEALFAGERGLSVIERLVDESGAWLSPRGWLVFEIAPHHHESVRELLQNRGYRDVRISPDLTGRDRVAEGRL